MKKWLIWFLIILLSVFPVFKERPLIAHANFGGGTGSVSTAPLPTRAEGVDVPSPTPTNSTVSNGAMCAMANVLTWEILQTYLYAITGQQAYDVYANDGEKQQALYSDFATFCQEMGYGTSVMFEFNKNMAYVGAVNLKDAVSYYKTAGTSALKEIQEEAKVQMQVIYGGKNNVSPAPSPTTGAIGVGKKQFCELLGSGALTKYVGNYITQLVNGERGEVSDTFLNSLGIPEFYFDGQYTLDSEGRIYFDGDSGVFCYLSDDKGYYVSLNPTKWVYDSVGISYVTYENMQNARIALLVDTSYCYYETYSKVKLYIYGLDDLPNHKINNDNLLNYPLLDKFAIVDSLGGIGSIRNDMLLADFQKLTKIRGIPVYTNKTEMQEFLKTGDPSKCLNYFKGEVTKPSDWLNYDFSQISEKLDQILKALTTLPTITTDDLAGFAQGVGNAVVAGNVPAADPATQQQQMQQILEESARETATRSLADSAMSMETETGGDDDTPRPTKTVEEWEEDQKKQDATMVVDWHEFFPFCVPYDMVRLIKVLNAEPKAPCFEGAIKYDKLNINVPVKLDLSEFDKAAEIFRLCETILFILGLILVTRNLIRG